MQVNKLLSQNKFAQLFLQTAMMLSRLLKRQEPAQVCVVAVDGCIGGGKSLVLENVATLAKALEDQFVVVRLEECVDDWMTLQMPDGEPLDLLTTFTRQAAETTQLNPYAGPFQMVTIASLLKRHNELLQEAARLIRRRPSAKTVLVLVERSMVGNKVFADMQHSAGNISDVQATAYNYFWTQVMATQKQMLALLGDSLGVPVRCHHVLLECDAEECTSRVARRPRSSATGEGGLSLDYMKELVHRHDAVYRQLAASEPNGRVHRVDSTQAPLDVAQALIKAVLA